MSCKLSVFMFMLNDKRPGTAWNGTFYNFMRKQNRAIRQTSPHRHINSARSCILFKKICMTLHYVHYRWFFYHLASQWLWPSVFAGLNIYSRWVFVARAGEEYEMKSTVKEILPRPNNVACCLEGRSEVPKLSESYKPFHDLSTWELFGPFIFRNLFLLKVLTFTSILLHRPFRRICFGNLK